MCVLERVEGERDGEGEGVQLETPRWIPSIGVTGHCDWLVECARWSKRE